MKIISNTAVAVAAAALLFANVASAATLTDAQVIQQVRDRAEIEELMWSYVRALDGMKPDEYAALYTPDGAFGPNKGTAALKKMMEDTKKNRDDRAAKGEKITAIYHSILNERVEFMDATHARVSAYYATFSAGAGQEVPARLIAVGRSIDTVTKLNGRWLIQNRDVQPKD